MRPIDAFSIFNTVDELYETNWQDMACGERFGALINQMNELLCEEFGHNWVASDKDVHCTRCETVELHDV